MRSLWFVILCAVVILAWHLGDRHGARELGEFTAECGSPGVRCYMLLTPEYVASHTQLGLPGNVTAAFFDDDGTLRGVLNGAGDVR